MNAEAVFWVIHIPLMVLFLVGMADVVSVWLRGRVDDSEAHSTGRKAGALLRTALAAIFSRRLPQIIKAFITEAWFNRRLWRTNRWRWLNHFLLVTAFMLLMVLSGLGALSDKVFHYVFHLEHVPWIAMWYNPDHPVTAVLNEVGSVLMTLGLIFFIVRRYVFRTPQLRTGPMDTWMVVGLGLILLSGWTTEIVRLSSSNVGPRAYLAFVGYPLSRLFAGLALPWERLFEWMYAGHGILTSLVIVTIPYSKFMHVIAGALVTMVREMEEEGSEHARLEKGAVRVSA
jgi:nitrate reductase gamma subunit